MKTNRIKYEAERKKCCEKLLHEEHLWVNTLELKQKNWTHGGKNSRGSEKRNA